MNSTIDECKIAIKNSNRYTHKGKLNDFKIIKSIDKKQINKQLNLSFKSFKESKKLK